MRGGRGQGTPRIVEGYALSTTVLFIRHLAGSFASRKSDEEAP